MATQFVKWWRTKFHTSSTHNCPYQAMSVLGSDTSDGRPSDTEDLVRDDTSSCNNGAHVNAGLASSSSSDSTSSQSQIASHHRSLFSPGQVKFEDFECDVQVEGSESGEERKEFSFTFYDLDGHGKITKDDIAGLVRSIYGAVNDSITVPQGGKKTIKVRLTVSPEQQKQQQQQRESNENNNNYSNLKVADTMGNVNSNSTSEDQNPVTNPISTDHQQHPPQHRTKLRNNVNVTIRENLNRERRPAEHRGHHLDKPKFSSVRIPNPNNCRGCRNLSTDIFRDCSASPMRNRKKWRERTACSLQLGGHQSPDLIELLQANMDKNNVSPCCRYEYHQSRQSPTPSPQHHPCSHNHLIDPGCPILPLLNNDISLCKEKLEDASRNCSPAPRPLNGLSGSKFFHHRNHLCKKHGHHRSRSHDLSQNIMKHLSDKDHPSAPQNHCTINNHNNYINISKNSNQHQQRLSTSHHEETLEVTGCISNKSPLIVNKNTNNLTQFTTTAAPTPHQLKHRNREQEHTRAIERVISWLERENLGGAEKKFSSPRKNLNPPVPSTPPAMKKHEHHHIHEHIHHHYHHYSKETPIIV